MASKFWRPNRYERPWAGPELARLGFGAELPDRADGRRVRGRLARPVRRGFLATGVAWPSGNSCFRVRPPRIYDPERLLDHALDFPNAVWRLHGVSAGPGHVACLLAFRYNPPSPTKNATAWSGSVLTRGPVAVIDDFTTAGCGRCWPVDEEWQVPDTGRPPGGGKPRGTRPFLIARGAAVYSNIA